MFVRALVAATSCAPLAWAASTSFSARPPAPPKVLAATGATETSLQSTRDLIYISSVNIAGQSYEVQLDTGSSDLWVHTPNGLASAQATGLTCNLTYGIGFSFGNIVTAPVEFAGFSVPKQALVDAKQAQNPVLNLGAVGVLGLGFTGLSDIDFSVNETDASYGRTFLFNVFAQDPSVPNFISILLSRDNDTEAPQAGTFTISEYDEQYASIANNPEIPTFPEDGPTRWTILLDAFAAGGKKYAVGTSVDGAPSKKAVILLDSGTTFTYAPESVVTAIFGGVAGATFNSSLTQWVLPCDTEIDVSLYVGEQQLDLHPLDMVVPSAVDPTICVGSFIPQNLAVAAGQFDWLVGVNVLRSLYAVYNFGDPVNGDQGVAPFVQLLQLVSAADASTDFHAVRGGTARNGSANAAPSDGGSTSPPSTGADQTVLSAGAMSALARMSELAPIFLGILALNAAILLVLLAAGIFWTCCRRRSRGGAGRRKGGSAAPPTAAATGYARVSTTDPTGRADASYERARVDSEDMPMSASGGDLGARDTLYSSVAGRDTMYGGGRDTMYSGYGGGRDTMYSDFGPGAGFANNARFSTASGIPLLAAAQSPARTAPARSSPMAPAPAQIPARGASLPPVDVPAPRAVPDGPSSPLTPRAPAALPATPRPLSAASRPASALPPHPLAPSLTPSPLSASPAPSAHGRRAMSPPRPARSALRGPGQTASQYGGLLPPGALAPAPQYDSSTF